MKKTEHEIKPQIMKDSFELIKHFLIIFEIGLDLLDQLDDLVLILDGGGM